MRSYADLLAIAAARKGGVDAVREGASVPLAPDELARIGDARWLEVMARRIFKAGLNDSVIEAKWPGISAAFGGFAPEIIALMPDIGITRLAHDPRLIRSATKIRAIRDNARFIRSLAAEGESFARRVAFWPVEDCNGLVLWLMKNGHRLGGNSAQYVLRLAGKEGWLLTTSVVARLEVEGIEVGRSRSAATLRRVQDAFDVWRAESGESLNMISHVLAVSIDSPH